ncbi:THSD4 [Acanthosepion pharaonis]|uniref:THSD4 n=1 Tax=Acanthosepion pharaonis TaxID=158019 RepID=A0A812DEU7_ACAPH|nr:THSD4 [Sepia pharaonis]
MKSSRNFLALKKDDDTYIINGRWPRSSPGQYKASDTVFHYNRHAGKSCVGECLHAQGPIADKLILQLLAYDRNPGIFYEYTIPSGMVPKILHKMKNIRPPPPRQIHPQPQAYSGQFYSQTCGGGTQETRILCVKMNSQVVVTDDNCDPDEKLPTQTTACNTKPCQARWTPSEWSPCSVSCGEGKKTRHVECQEKISPTFSKRVSATVCLNQTRLPTVTKCVEKPCSQWVVKEWSKCSVECGLGHRKREVRCVGADDKVLTDRKCTEPKPTTSDVCDMGSCAKAWFFTEWSKECSASCGHGLLHRKVHCSADNGESLPDNKCKQNTKPKSEKTCKSERPCGGLWFTGPWSECTATCGQGVKVRDVTCVNKLNRNSFTVAEESNCLKEEKPATEELCETLPDCPPEWYTSQWTECSASCGTGSKSRETKCVDANLKQSILCDISERPVTRQSCNTNSCLQIPLNTDPMCRDHMKQCKMVVQARLCPYPYYKQRCCETCRKHYHHHHPS